jgi:2-dehydro-3-deoxyphosphooctonate aldolase (KDO 8-P synthase)
MDKNIIIAGPCALDSSEINFAIASTLSSICKDLDMKYVFKGSFDKANRLSIDSGRGKGIEASIPLYQEIKQKLNIDITTDVHSIEQVEIIEPYVEIIQIPAFLARQTDLIIESARTGKIVNIKKAQFMNWSDVILAAEKASRAGAREVWITERGTMFGYKDLIVDYRNFFELLRSNYKVFFDATHSVQKPGGDQKSSAGERKYVPLLIAAAAASGVRNLFFETHPNPTESVSDGKNMVPLDKVKGVLFDFASIAAYRRKNEIIRLEEI